jgi:hypothetical protein
VDPPSPLPGRAEHAERAEGAEGDDKRDAGQAACHAGLQRGERAQAAVASGQGPAHDQPEELDLRAHGGTWSGGLSHGRGRLAGWGRVGTSGAAERHAGPHTPPQARAASRAGRTGSSKDPAACLPAGTHPRRRSAPGEGGPAEVPSGRPAAQRLGNPHRCCATAPPSCPGWAGVRKRTTHRNGGDQKLGRRPEIALAAAVSRLGTTLTNDPTDPCAQHSSDCGRNHCGRSHCHQATVPPAATLQTYAARGCSSVRPYRMRRRERAEGAE